MNTARGPSKQKIMSDALHIHPATTTHVGHDDHGHHKETFISKYIFSMDHKTIGKQFLITGIIWAGFARSM